MFKDLSIRKKMNYLVAIATTSIIFAAIFVFGAMSDLKKDYNNLYENSMKAGLSTLIIEKNMNHVSRNDRDIMLGGPKEKDIVQIKSNIATVQKNFQILETLKNTPQTQALIKKAKVSTLRFLNEAFSMMQKLTPDEIQNDKEKIFHTYRKTLTPLAEDSRKYFKKLVALKQQELAKNSKSLQTKITFYKYLVLIAGLFVALVVFILAVIIRKSITSGIERFTQLISHATKGDFSHKYTASAENTELGIMGTSLSILLEHIQTLISQINTTITNASKGDFNKKISTEGLSGEFIVAIKNVSKSIDFMQEQHQKAQRDSVTNHPTKRENSPELQTPMIQIHLSLSFEKYLQLI